MGPWLLLAQAWRPPPFPESSLLCSAKYDLKYQLPPAPVERLNQSSHSMFRGEDGQAVRGGKRDMYS